MKQRSLVNNKPWVFIGPEGMPDDDNYLVEQQLNQGMARGRPPKQVLEPMIPQGEAELADFVNKVAVQNIKTKAVTTTGAQKRKRTQSAEIVIEEEPRKRRIAKREDNVTEPRGAGEAIPARLGRPSQGPRDMVQNAPAAKKKGNEIWEPSHATEPLANDAVIRPPEKRLKPKTRSKTSGTKTNASGNHVAPLEETDTNEEELDPGSGKLRGDVDDVDDGDDGDMTDPGDDEENNQHMFDLLGLEMEWEKILRAARSVGGSELSENRMPTLQTKTIKVLISEVRKARTLYQNRPYDEPMDALQELLITIEDRIKNDSISEAKASSKKSQMIRDIYACAIPALVFLLESALSFHALHPKGLRRYEALQDIVRLQEMIISLSIKAKIWKTKPHTDKPIIKPTTGTILPYTREMRKGLEMELKEQKRKWKISQNASKTAGSVEELAKYSQQQRELSIMETNKRFARGLPYIQRARENFRASRKPIGSLDLQFSQENDVPRHSTHWNAEEEKELMRQLQLRYARDQSGTSFGHFLYFHASLTTLIAEVRYLAILNTRLLQNKLPERIREKALELKPFLKEEYGACDWIESIL